MKSPPQKNILQKTGNRRGIKKQNRMDKHYIQQNDRFKLNCGWQPLRQSSMIPAF